MPKVRQNQIGEAYSLHCKQFINDLSKRCNANEVDTETLLLAIDMRNVEKMKTFFRV